MSSGDFNSNLLDPKDSGHLKDLLEVYGLKNLIKLPTRIAYRQDIVNFNRLDFNKQHKMNIFIGRSGCSYQRSFSNIYHSENHSSAIAISQIQLRSLKNFEQDLFLRDLHSPFSR